MVKGFIKVFLREVDLLLRNKFILLVIFILPLIFISMVITTFSAGTPEELPIGVIDLDNSKLSRSIIRQLNETKSCHVEKLYNSINDGNFALSGGEIYALIVIPRKFESDVKSNVIPKVVYYYNNQMILTGGIVSKDIGTVLQNIMAGLSIKSKMKHGISAKSAKSSTNLIRLDERIKGNPYLNYSYFLTYVLIAHIYQVFITLVSVWTTANEFKKGTTTQWLDTANGSILIALFGKLFIYFVIFYTNMSLCYLCYVTFFPAPFNGDLLFVAEGLALFILAYMMMGVLFVSLTSNFRKAVSFGAIYTSLGFSFSGMTYPSLALTDFADNYSRILPIRPFTNLIINQALRGISPEYNYDYLWWLCIYIFIGLMSVFLLKKHVRNTSLCFQS